MISFPLGFIATRYPGYFFETKSNQLYSVKITGTLKPLKLTKYWNPRGNTGFGLTHGEAGYQISHRGRRHFMPLRELKRLTPKNHVIPRWEEELV